MTSLLRRLVLALAAASGVLSAVPALGAIATDDFQSGGYGGGTGWAGNWIETNDDGAQTTGDVAVLTESGSLRLQVKDNDVTARRAVNLNGAITATLSFDYKRVSLDDANDYVMLQLSYNGGTTWFEVARFAGPGTDAAYTRVSYDITSFASANTVIRFVGSPNLGNTDIVYFDNVVVDYTVAGTPGPGQPDLSRCTPLTGGGNVNTYYPGTASIAAGVTSIPVGAQNGTQPIAAGDTLLIMQMQDAAINSANSGAYGDGVAGDPARGATAVNNAGRFEYVIAAGPVSGGNVPITTPTMLAYTNAAATGTQGQRRYQVIRVMSSPSGSLVNGLTAPPWNGSTGGVVAVDVTGALNLNNAVVDVSGRGFRGGGGRQLGGGAGANTDYRTLATNNANAQKGEGTAGTPRYVYTPAGGLVDTGVEGYPNGSSARGAPGNAGGGGTDGNPGANDQNTGGGGGGNAGVGGVGGWAWVPSGTPPQTGGFGGDTASPAANRLPMGGGGGAGTTNNSTGTPPVLASSGAAGGGVIMIRAGSMTGAAFLFARGAAGNVTVGNDATGGGGAGGSVLLYSAAGTTGTATIDVSGGAGGSNDGGGVSHGPGGGGGGGFIALSGTGAGVTTDVAGGPNGLTVAIGGNGTTYPTPYGATAGTAGSVTTGVVAGTIPGAGLPSSCTTIANFLINVGGASASTCTPKSITITARDASNNVLTGYTGTMNLSTSTGRGDWAIVTGSGTLNNGTANDGVATYTFAAADNGVAVLSLSNASADDLTVSAVDGGTPSTLSTSSTINFRDNAFVVTEDPIQVAGRNQSMTATLWRRDPSTGNNCAIATGYTGARALDAWITRDVQDPGGAAPTIGALALPSAAPASNPASNNLSLTFVNGVATFNMATTDVGKYVLNLRDDTRSFASGVDISGSTAALTTRPFALYVDVPGNPGANTPTGTFFRAAGSNFSGTVRAVRWEAGDDANNDGVPDAGANLNNAATPSYAWPTTLAPTTPFTPATPADSPAGTGVAGSINNGSIAQGSFSGGAATVANLQYTEVGSFTLRATATNFLGSAGVNIATTSGVVGRFRPFDFGVAYNTPQFASFCGTSPNAFTYVGQLFPYAAVPVITVTARNAQGGTTQNYTQAGGWFKLTNASLAGKAYSALTGTLDLSLVNALATDPVIANTGGGNATLTFADGGGLAFVRTAPVAPFNAEISLAINVLDTEAVAFAGNPARFGAATAGNGIAFGQGKEMRFGRLRLLSAVGSERLALQVPMRLEYWNGFAFVTNDRDGCTTIPRSAIQMGTYQGNLNACETAFGGATITFAGGTATPTLAAPGASNNGSVDLTVNLSAASGQFCATAGGAQAAASNANRAHLKGRWNASDDDGNPATTHDDDPRGRAAFGIYGTDKTPNQFIYFRENY